MKRNIGRMRDRLDVIAPVRVADGALGYNRQNDVVATLWARIEPAGGSEIYRYGHLEQQISHKITIRHNPLVDQGTLLREGDRTFYVMVVVDPTERGEFMELMCREGGNE